MKALLEATTAKPDSFVPRRSRPSQGIQRKCGCGGISIGGGECDRCRQKGLDRQRAASQGSFNEDRVAAFGSCGFSRDFSQVPATASRRGFRNEPALSNLGDNFEQEADRVANAIMRAPEPELELSSSSFSRGGEAGPGQRIRATPQQENGNGKNIQLKELPDSEQDAVSDRGDGVTNLGGRGEPLPKAARAFFDARFGYDFSEVRVQADSEGAELARSLNARAFTMGRTIVFGAGEFAPQSVAGKELLAHELTHVIQQGGPQTRPVPRIQFQKKPKKEEKKKEAPKAPVDKERTKWRFHYGEKAAAEGKVNFVKGLGLNPEQPFKDAEGWTFFYFPRTKDGAAGDAVLKQKELGDKHTVTAEHSDLARSWFVRIILKCPEGIPEKKGFQVWPKCFASQNEADALVTKFKGNQIKAETVSVAEAQKFGVYFEPLTEKAALAVGTSLAQRRPGFMEGMYTVTAAEKKELRSFAPSISTTCPAGYTDVGQFELTAYVFALESEFPAEPKVKDPCGLKGEFNQDFLFKTKGKAPLGVKMEGSGITRAGKIINWAPKGGEACFAISDCARTKIGECAKVGRTVAVDSSEIPLRSELLIEDIGARVAEDTGGAIKGKHIDVYYGTLPSSEADKLSFKNKKVCKKKGK